MKDYVAIINRLRLDNKNKWYQFVDERVQIKGYNTWIQIFRVDGKNYPGLMDISVKEFKNHIAWATKDM